MENNRNFFKKLLDTPSPCGYELDCVNIFDEQMKSIPGSTHRFRDRMFNSCWKRSGKSGSKRIMLSGHIDNNSFMVSKIENSGLIHFITQGGPDIKCILDGEFYIITKSGNKIYAIVSKKAIHLEDRAQRAKAEELSDLYLNVGAKTDKEVKSLGIEVGDLVVYKPNCNLEFGPNKDMILSQGLDDKVGVYITEEVFRTAYNDNIHLYGVAATQEEVGCRGAITSAIKVNPDISIDIDVGHETCQDIVGSKVIWEEGDIELGKGPIIEYGPDKNRILIGEMRKVADKLNIPYQLKASYCGGTNTEKIQINCSDCATLSIGIPCRYMHTSREIVNWNDVDNAVLLIRSFIETIK